jgi:hypothetical protein
MYEYNIYIEMDELNQIITQVIMNLNHNDKNKIMKNMNKKEIITNLIYNLLKNNEDINDNEDNINEDEEINEDENKKKYIEKINIIDNETYMSLLNGMCH